MQKNKLGGKLENSKVREFELQLACSRDSDSGGATQKDARRVVSE